MLTEPEKVTVSISESEHVTTLLYFAAKKGRAGITVLLGHGAGANQMSPFMRMFASGLAARGFDAMTFNFLYAEQGRRFPDPKAKLESCYRRVIAAALANKKLKNNRLIIGGKSMGGRIASQVAAEKIGLAELTRPNEGRERSKKAGSKTDTGNNEKKNAGALAGLVFLGYPLHPPGKPEQSRDQHLKDIRAPMLFVQGSRDAFGAPAELRSVIKKLRLPATLQVIEGGDHSFKVPKGASVPQQKVYETAIDDVARWLHEEVE